MSTVGAGHILGVLVLAGVGTGSAEGVVEEEEGGVALLASFV